MLAQATRPVGDVELWGLIKAGYLGPGFVGRKRRVLDAVQRGDCIPLRKQGNVLSAWETTSSRAQQQLNDLTFLIWAQSPVLKAFGKLLYLMLSKGTRKALQAWKSGGFQVEKGTPGFSSGSGSG